MGTALLSNWTARAHQRVGDAVRNAALRDATLGQIGKISMSTRVAQGLSALVLIAPYLLMVGGAVLCLVGFPHVLLMVFGALICAIGVYVRPRRPTVVGRFFTRDDLPQLFALTDQVSDRLGGRKITKVQLSDDFNAYSI